MCQFVATTLDEVLLKSVFQEDPFTFISKKEKNQPTKRPVEALPNFTTSNFAGYSQFYASLKN